MVLLLDTTSLAFGVSIMSVVEDYLVEIVPRASVCGRYMLPTELVLVRVLNDSFILQP